MPPPLVKSTLVGVSSSLGSANGSINDIAYTNFRTED